MINFKIFLPHEPHVNKELRKAIMKRSRLKNKANKSKKPIDISNFKKLRNYVVNLNKQANFEYLSSYNSTDSKLLWVNCKPYFSNKYSKADTDIVLNENGDSILKNEEIAKTFNDYFGTIVDNLDVHHWEGKILLHQTLLIKLMTLSRILKNIQAFGI